MLRATRPSGEQLRSPDARWPNPKRGWPRVTLRTSFGTATGGRGGRRLLRRVAGEQGSSRERRGSRSVWIKEGRTLLLQWETLS